MYHSKGFSSRLEPSKKRRRLREKKKVDAIDNTKEVPLKKVTRSKTKAGSCKPNNRKAQAALAITPTLNEKMASDKSWTTSERAVPTDQPPYKLMEQGCKASNNYITTI